MSGDWIEMSQRERDRLKVMAPVLEGRRTQSEAGMLLKRCVRRVRRIQRRLATNAESCEQDMGNASEREQGREQGRSKTATEPPSMKATPEPAERSMLLPTGIASPQPPPPRTEPTDEASDEHKDGGGGRWIAPKTEQTGRLTEPGRRARWKIDSGASGTSRPLRLGVTKTGRGWKIAQTSGRSIVFLDETGLMLQALVRRTLAPQGCTPVMYSWDRLSVIVA